MIAELAENEEDRATQERKHGLTSWLKAKLFRPKETDQFIDQDLLKELADITKVGRYEIVDKLGQGSMGMVYLGKDPYIKRDVAIKI